MRTVVLVRHAAAGKRSAWQSRPDRDRPLDGRGREQAVLLGAELVSEGPPAALVASPYLRCVQTLEPLAVAAGVRVETSEALAEAADPPPLPGDDPWLASAWAGGRALGLLDRLLHELPEGGRAIACSHGDVLPALLALLVARDDVHLDRVHLRKAARAALEFTDGRCTAVALSPPPDERAAG